MTQAPPDAEVGSYKATLSAHGLYDTFQFVLRLSPEVHRLLAETENGITNKVGFEHAKAFSTYLHETIHWWQHIGSTYGFMMSLCYPTQVYGNYNRLRELIGSAGFQKPIRKMVEHLPEPKGVGTPAATANVIVNNHFDFTAFRNFTFNTTHAKMVAEDPYFENIGHAFNMTYANNILVLSSTVDRDLKSLQDPRIWEASFQELRNQKEPGFYYGSPVELWGIGAHEIFEGQARFGQIQYLAFGSGGNLTWDDFREMGMLSGVYVTAFNLFLKESGLDWPPQVDHTTTGLFLLICDMAINPGAGFPLPIKFFHSFISDIDPGSRFRMLSALVRLKCPGVVDAIKEYSRAEYERVSEELAAALIVDSPLLVAETCSRWTEDGAPFAALMEEYRTFDYGPVNQPIRVMFSHFLAFMQDKFATPEYFCWPGAWMAGHRVGPMAMELFERHSALFIDKENDDGVFPRLHPNRDMQLVQKMFDSFYAANVTFDMTDQWIIRPGPFTYNFGWLKQGSRHDEMKAFVDRQFAQAYGVGPDTAQIIQT